MAAALRVLPTTRPFDRPTWCAECYAVVPLESRDGENGRGGGSDGDGRGDGSGHSGGSGGSGGSCGSGGSDDSGGNIGGGGSGSGGNCGDGGAVKLRKCSRCWYARYCSRACQIKHWRRHHEGVCDRLSLVRE